MPDFALTWSIVFLVWGAGLVIVNKRSRTRFVIVAAVVALLGAAQVADAPVVYPPSESVAHERVEKVYPAPDEYIRGCNCSTVEDIVDDLVEAAKEDE